MVKDFYLVLGVSRGADVKKIKQAYRRIAKEHHPDVSGSKAGAEKLIEVREAYETLTDESRRREYDEELERQGSSVKITRAPDIIRRRTSKKKYKLALSKFTEWIKMYRNKRKTWIFKRLNMKLRGYYNYYGVIGNMEMLLKYFNSVQRLLFKWLNRRSQRKSYNYKGFRELCKHFRVLRPRIVEKPVSAFA